MTDIPALEAVTLPAPTDDALGHEHPRYAPDYAGADPWEADRALLVELQKREGLENGWRERAAEAMLTAGFRRVVPVSDDVATSAPILDTSEGRGKPVAVSDDERTEVQVSSQSGEELEDERAAARADVDTPDAVLRDNLWNVYHNHENTYGTARQAWVAAWAASRRQPPAPVPFAWDPKVTPAPSSTPTVTRQSIQDALRAAGQTLLYSGQLDAILAHLSAAPSSTPTVTEHRLLVILAETIGATPELRRKAARAILAHLNGADQ